MRIQALDQVKAYLNLVAIRLYQRLRGLAIDMQWTRLYKFSQARISSLEDEYTELTGRRLDL